MPFKYLGVIIIRDSNVNKEVKYYTTQGSRIPGFLRVIT